MPPVTPDQSQAPIEPQAPESPLYQDATHLVEFGIEPPEADTAVPLDQAPVAKTPDVAETVVEAAETTNEDIAKMLSEVGSKLDKIIASFDPPANRPIRTEPLNPAAKDNVVSIYKRGQQPSSSVPSAPVTPIEVAEDLKAHPAPDLSLVTSPITSTDIPGVIPTSGQEVPAPALPPVEHVPSAEELAMLRPQTETPTDTPVIEVAQSEPGNTALIDDPGVVFAQPTPEAPTQAAE